MIDVQHLPTINCGLNAAAATLLVAGYLIIKRTGNVERHRTCMLAATACSILFLISYLTYHAIAGSKGYEGEGSVRTVYFAILISHSILAVVNVPLVIVTLIRAFRDDRERHRRIARWTLPIWLYVSVTGVLVYLMLYVWA